MVQLAVPAQESVRFENITVCYRVPSERFTTFKEFAIRTLQGRIRQQEFQALDNVSFSVHRGEVFGVIGRNGAGKSTLLKLVARVMRPTRGRVVVFGRVAPLLEVGAGFHPDLTGRENVFLNGALLGFTRKEIERDFDRIVDFSELHPFIDAPLRTYSSGMYARLGFAVASNRRPDILIVDEILGVGDEAFQRKCQDRIMSFREAGTTILFVSHNSDMVEEICNRVALLDHGRLLGIGRPAEMLDRYHQDHK